MDDHVFDDDEADVNDWDEDDNYDEDYDGSDMTTDSWIGNACNGHNLTGLSGYGKRTIDGAMKLFFEKEVMKPNNRYAAAVPAGAKYSTPAAHYVFSAGHEDYGQCFASYIEEHKLGALATVGRVENVKYHPRRMCQVWVWAPDKKALIAWYEDKHGPKVEVPAPAVGVKAVAKVARRPGAKKLPLPD